MSYLMRKSQADDRRLDQKCAACGHRAGAHRGLGDDAVCIEAEECACKTFEQAGYERSR